MLDYITINASITLEDAMTIRTKSKFSFVYRTADDVFTNELQKAGVIQVSVWVAPSGLYLESYSTINATIRAQKFFADGIYDFSPVIGLIESYLPLDKIEQLEWKLQSASFVYYFTGKHIKDYYDFLQKGRDLKNRHLMKRCEISKQEKRKIYLLTFSSIHRKKRGKNIIMGIPKELLRSLPVEKQKEKRREERPIYDSVGLEFELSYDESAIYTYGTDIAYVQQKVKENRLLFRAKLKKAKIRPLCKKFGIQERSLFQFQEKIFQIDEDILAKYIGEIAGTGRYYKFYDAEEIVRRSEQFKKNQKQKMQYALKGVAQYKGIDKFLNHAEDESYPPAYEYMSSFKRRAVALEALRNLESLGINPVTLPVRKRDSASDSLANLIDVYRDSIHNGTPSVVATVVAKSTQLQAAETTQQTVYVQAVPMGTIQVSQVIQQPPPPEDEDIGDEWKDAGFQEELHEWEYEPSEDYE